MFYRFVNSDGKAWVMPADRLRIAMNMYQPSSSNGKLLKALLPWLHRLGAVRRRLGIECLDYRLPGDVEAVISDIFGDDIDVSIFEGTPSVHKKMTIQVSRGSKLLGYCKTTESTDVYKLFENEQKILARLHECGVEGVPRCLYCGHLSDGKGLFVQSTEKTLRSKVVHQWTDIHEKWIQELHDRTKQTICFEDSDLSHTLNEMEAHINWLPEKYRDVVTRTIATVRCELAGKEGEYSAYHADFTPWNMSMERGRLFVFDWEYGRLTYPSMIDKYHYHIQSAIFERKEGATEIGKWLVKEPWVETLMLRIYLLDAVTRFTLREDGPTPIDPLRQTWLDLLSL